LVKSLSAETPMHFAPYISYRQLKERLNCGNIIQIRKTSVKMKPALFWDATQRLVVIP